MIIGFFADTYYPQLNGVVIAVDELAKSLREKGHTVYIIAPKIAHYKDTDPFVIRLGSFRLLRTNPAVMCPYPLPSVNLLKVFKLNFDLIHAHGNSVFSLLGYEVAHAKKIPFILTFHTLLTEYTHYFLKGKIIKPRMVARGLRMFGNLCDAIISPSEKMKQALLSYGVKKEIAVIPNFIDTEKFSNSKKFSFQQKLNLDSKAKIILTVGRLAKEKNFSFLIDVFEKVVEKKPLAHLILVGYGPEKSNLQKKVRRKKLTKNIHFLGRIEREELLQLYMCADLFTFASSTEVHPLVVLEAAAASIPLVLIDDLAFSGIINNEENGFIVEQDSNLFAQKILLLLNDEKLRKEMGKKSREIIEKSFNKQLLTGSMEKFYFDTLATFSKKKPRKLFTKKFALKQIYKAKNTFDKFVKYWI